MLLSELRVSTGAVLQLQLRIRPWEINNNCGRRRRLGGRGGAAGNKPVETSIYYKPRHRLDASATVINRKRLEPPIGAREPAVKKARVHDRSTGEGSSFVLPDVKNEDVLMDVVSDNTEDLVPETDDTILESALQNHCRIFQCPSQELPDHLKQCGCDIEMKINLVPAD